MIVQTPVRVNVGGDAGFDFEVTERGVEFLRVGTHNGQQLLSGMALEQAVEFAKAILAAQEQAQFEAEIEEMYRRTLDRAALYDDALESDVRFWRENAYIAGSVKLEPADMLPY